MTDGYSTEAERFEALCGPYSGMVYRHCLHMLRHPQEAEDAAQESMLRAFRAFGRFRGAGVATWLFRIAHNTCLDVLKSARSRRESASAEPWVQPGGELSADAPTPEESYVRTAENDRLWQAVSTLDPRWQTLIALYYGEGMTYEQIAAATGLKAGTVKSRLSRARDALQKKLEKN